MTDCDSTVLVVEDDAELNRLMGAYVSLCGCKYRSALTGTQAVDSATGRAPSLVLLDLMLPDIDGFEVCRYLRAAAQTRNVPIVIVSALSGQKEIDLGKACGANEYLTKPVAPDQLIKTIKHYARSGGAGA